MIAILLALIIALLPTAQTACGTAGSLVYPVDTEVFQLAQGYAVPSTRHQGRYHTGEDWTLPRGEALFQPIYAAGVGRVTYSSPIGWGRDGGAVVIEHTFADGSVLYTMVGHLAETDDIKFPRVNDCVQQGDIIAAAGSARPAPHVHFEVRSILSDAPGPGYTRDNPSTTGFLEPAEAIRAHSAVQ